jgi:hypothetical protein
MYLNDRIRQQFFFFIKIIFSITNNRGTSMQDTFLALKSYLANRPDGTFQWDKSIDVNANNILAGLV